MGDRPITTPTTLNTYTCPPSNLLPTTPMTRKMIEDEGGGEGDNEEDDDGGGGGDVDADNCFNIAYTTSSNKTRRINFNNMIIFNKYNFQSKSRKTEALFKLCGWVVGWLERFQKRICH